MPSLKTTFNRLVSFAPTWQTQLDDYVQSVVWSPRGEIVAVAGVSGPIMIYETRTGQVKHRLNGHNFGTTILGFDPQGQLLASAGQDGKIRVWDAETGAELMTLPGGASWVEHIAWNDDGQYLATAAGRKLRLWNRKGDLLQEYPDHKNTIAAIQWKPGQPVLASAQYNSIQLWRPDATEPVENFERRGSVLVMRWSPDGKYLASGDQDATCGFWLVETGLSLQMWGYPTKVRELAWDSTSRYLATGGSPVVTVWDCSGKGPEGSTPITLKAHKDVLSALAFQHRGSLLASGGSDGLVALWQVSKQKLTKPLVQARFGAGISQLSWSPNDRSLAVGTENGDVALFTLPV